MGNRRNARKRDTKKQSRESVERNERRIRRRNEEIKKGGIEIAKKANEKMEKEEEEEKKKDERRRTEDSLGVVCTLIYVAAYISAKGGKDEWETKDREERKKRVEPNGEKRELLRLREGEENRETIGGAEAAAFHVAWHRLPLKSLLLFVSSSKIMIVCPRDLLLGGSLDAPCTRVGVCVRTRIYVRTRVCA